MWFNTTNRILIVYITTICKGSSKSVGPFLVKSEKIKVSKRLLFCLEKDDVQIRLNPSLSSLEP